MNDGTQKSIVDGSKAVNAKRAAKTFAATILPVANSPTTDINHSVAMVQANFNCLERAGILDLFIQLLST